jgi:hypothetical protein
MESAGPVCACGCGELVRKARYPSQQPRYINGHQHRGEHNGNFRGGKVKGACAVCGASFTHFPSQPQVTCAAPACYAAWQGLTTAARGRNRVTVICAQCGAARDRFPSQVKERNFCGRSCQGAFKGALEVGPNGGNWRGGKLKYLTNQTRIRDGGACVICGFHLVTEVHHITPVSSGGLHECANLVTVCPNHHRLAHVGLINLEAYRRLDWQPAPVSAPSRANR